LSGCNNTLYVVRY